jgi:ArsR family transcriptional regulator
MSMNAPHARVAGVAKALSDRTRLELLLAIAMVPEHSCAELVRAFPVSQATVSHHLKILVAAGLVTVRRSGQFHHYRVVPGALADWAGELIRLFAPAGRAILARQRIAQRAPSAPSARRIGARP